MKITGRAMLLATCLAATLHATESFMDRVDEALTFSSPDSVVRARISGTVDLEAYRFSQPAPGLIETTDDALFNPRLTTFLDVELGHRVYGFVQARIDRGFDPSDEELQARVDEYAVRISPWDDGRASVQMGKFATVVGSWVQRHGSWDNPFVTAPLPYENLTGVWDASGANSSGTLLGWAHVLPRPTTPVPVTDKYLRLPIIWGPSYAKGVAVSGILGRLTYAAELKNGSLASRPDAWQEDRFFDGHQTASGRLGYRPNPMWNFGASWSDGPYLRQEAGPTVPAGRRFDDYRQRVFAQDVSFAWHRLQIWAEAFQTRFVIPGVGNADTAACYIEAKYKLTPQLAGALRWNQQTFGTIPHAGSQVRWGSNVSRVDAALNFRWSAHTEFKVQYSLEHQVPGLRDYQHLLAFQFVQRF